MVCSTQHLEFLQPNVKLEDMDPNICRRVKFLIGCPVMIIRYFGGNLFGVLESCLASQYAVCAVGHFVSFTYPLSV